MVMRQSLRQLYRLLKYLEAAYPVQFTQWALRPDSGGKGKFRGGLGAIYEIELLEESATAFLFGERGKYAPQGVVGGEEGAKTNFILTLMIKNRQKNPLL